MKGVAGILALALGSHALDEAASHSANPIRKVVTLLQNMEKKVSSEAEKEKELHDKYMCYCKNGGAALEKSISDAGIRMPELESAISEGESKLKQTKEDVAAHQTDRAAAKQAMAEATSVREKEAEAFTAEEAELKANLAAMKKAVTAINNGMGGSFVQTATAQTLKKLVMDRDGLNDGERGELVAFLSNDAEAPGAGEISGILKTMADEMTADLKTIVTTEGDKVKSYDELISSKKKMVEALTQSIEKKLKRIGKLGIDIVQMKNDLGESGESLIEDKKFLADLDKNCADKQQLFDDNVKMRGQELLALQDTIKMLNSDDALELFKKSLPGAASFMQVKESTDRARVRVSRILREAVMTSKHQPSIDFILLALHGKKTGFGKVIKLIDSLVGELKTEQVDDENKKEYCLSQFDLTEDKKKSVERDINGLEKDITDAEEGIKTTTAELDALGDGIRQLDKSVAEATEQRKEESSDYSNLMASNTAAVELLNLAKNRLNKFYNPKLASVLQSAESPGPAPEGVKAYSKNTEGGNGVVAMIDLLIKDLEKEITEAEFTEKDSQQDYERMMADASAKRAEDSKSITDKAVAKSDMAVELEESKAAKESAKKTLMATEEYISNLHADCDWLIKYFNIRQEARTGEIDALSKAKAVLSGADFSLLQKSKVSFLRRQ